MPDITVDNGIRRDLNQRLGAAEAALAGAINTATGDGIIARSELERTVRDSFRNQGDAFIQARTDALFNRITAIANQNGNTAIDQPAEVAALVAYASSAEAHRTAGGAIVRLPGNRTVQVELYCPTLTEAQFRETLRRYELFRHLGNIAYSFTAPVLGQTDQFYTFTMVTLNAAVSTMVWPTVTLLTLSRRENTVQAQWQLVPRAQLQSVVDSNRSGFAAALQAAGKPNSPDDVQNQMNEFINEAHSVTRSAGFYRLDLSTGVLVYNNSSTASLGGWVSDSRLIETALETALVTCGDPRARSRPEIPSWTYEGNSGTPDRDTIEPSD